MNELYHHGVKGMKWGIRRYQNEDGSYTKAGIKRYALDRDVNDTSRRNVAAIRTGEAKRRLDVAKVNSKKPNNDYRVAELQGRLRSAKRMQRNVRSIDRGAKLAAKGKTISGNNRTYRLALLGASIGYKVLNKHLNTRINTLQNAGQLRVGHVNAGKFLNNMGAAAYYTIALGGAVKLAYDNRNLRSYNTEKWTGGSSIKYVGSQEFKDRRDSVKKKNSK